MKSFDDSELLLKEISSKIEQGKKTIISIDGKNGCGKTTLSDFLSSHLYASHINLDNFLEKNKGNYVKFIMYEQLINKLKEITNKIVIIEGICVLRILDNIKLVPNIKVYVKRVKKDGFWFDGLINFDYERTADEIISEQQENSKEFFEIFGESESDNDTDQFKEGMTDEIIRYHFDYKPDLNCDMVYERIDE